MIVQSNIKYQYELSELENKYLQVILAYFLENYSDDDVTSKLARDMQTESDKAEERIKEN